MASISARAAVSTFHLAVMQLLECAGFTDTDALTDITVNFDGRSMRIDIAKLTPDGLHVEQWLCGFSVNPNDLPNFGRPVGLPGTDGATH